MTVVAYLDNNATTAMAPEVLEAMLPFLRDQYLNPSSVAGELLGAARPLGAARRALARLLGDAGLAERFTLTSGASEANSWAVHAATVGRLGPSHLVSTAIEHPSLLAALEARRRRGDQVDLVKPTVDGVVEPDAFASALRPDTAFASFMFANNETGVVQPVAALVAAVRRVAPSALVHVDATQAVGKLPLDLDADFGAVDLVSLSAHKFHGPKGVGALYVRTGLRLEPLIHGSDGEGDRGGTPDPSRAAGMAAAACAALARTGAWDRVRVLRDGLEASILAMAPHARINGRGAARLPNTISVTIPGLDAGDAIAALAAEGVCVSGGSACSSGSPEPSHVLLAMGMSREHARSTLRLSLSDLTEAGEAKAFLDRLAGLL